MKENEKKRIAQQKKNELGLQREEKLSSDGFRSLEERFGGERKWDERWIADAVRRELQKSFVDYKTWKIDENGTERRRERYRSEVNSSATLSTGRREEETREPGADGSGGERYLAPEIVEMPLFSPYIY